MTENMSSDDLNDHKKECLIANGDTHKMKDKDFSNWIVNILDQLEVSCTRYGRKCNLNDQKINVS